ncbi:MAG: ATPase [Pseudomonadota bacterium]
MIYASPADWRAATNKRVLLFGMSGLGKTHVSNLLRQSGGWFHYSVDYRIGTRYMGEHIADNFKAEAMKVPFLAELLRTDSIFVASNITFNNLAPLSTYLGKPGDPDLGGIAFAEYLRRQEQHRRAEVSALLDTAHFIERAQTLYGYQNFVCDSGGSICEVVDPDDPADPVMRSLARDMLLVWIEGSPAHTKDLIARFDRDPKPMYYQPDFLARSWEEFGRESGCATDKIDPDGFVRWTYSKAMDHRQPRYDAMARNWGLKVSAAEIEKIRDATDFNDVIETALAAH